MTMVNGLIATLAYLSMPHAHAQNQATVTLLCQVVTNIRLINQQIQCFFRE